MATPRLDTISKDLAYKLQDPVLAGNLPGVRLTADERLGYILRGYRRLLRVITMLHPNLIQKMFQNYYLSETGTTGSGGVFGVYSYAEIYDIYCKEPSDEEYFKAEFMTPDIFYDIETGRNSFYKPDLNDDRYFWTRQNTYVRILPAVELDYKIIYRPDTIALIQTDGQGGDYDLDIPTEYQDILLTFAAIEGYLDIGQTDMVQIHRADLDRELVLLAALKQNREKDDNKNTP